MFIFRVGVEQDKCHCLLSRLTGASLSAEFLAGHDAPSFSRIRARDRNQRSSGLTLSVAGLFATAPKFAFNNGFDAVALSLGRGPADACP
jgi:hypothetical protein